VLAFWSDLIRRFRSWRQYCALGLSARNVLAILLSRCASTFCCFESRSGDRICSLEGLCCCFQLVQANNNIVLDRFPSHTFKSAAYKSPSSFRNPLLHVRRIFISFSATQVCTKQVAPGDNSYSCNREVPLAVSSLRLFVVLHSGPYGHILE
jgi:hypothetical protein